MLDNRSKFEYLANQWISLWNSPIDLNLFDELHSDDFIDLSSSGRPSDKNGFKEGILKLLNAFPNLQTNVDDILIDFEKSQIAVRWHSIGINKQKYLGIGTTEKLTKITGIEIIEIKEDKIVKRWGEWDILDHLNK